MPLTDERPRPRSYMLAIITTMVAGLAVTFTAVALIFMAQPQV